MIDDTEYDLNADSFLSQSARNLSSTMLAWHYRSRYESLISFSNHAFYHGNLLTIPDRSLQLKQSPEIICENIAEAKTQAELTLERSISYHYLPNGIYEKRKNKDEAHYIALHVRELLNQNNGLSIGIVAFSEAQQEEIESALERLAKEDSAFKTRLRAEMDREEDGQYLGLFVKNLENVQGDERDIIILSICYAKDPQGKMRMNFGPINKSGGEKRLNVIFSRSKKHMAVISSIQGNVITNTYNDGANCLKNYLEYSAAVSRSDLTASRTILGQLQLHSDEQKHKFQISAAAKRISEALEQKGWICEFNVGQSSFRCDLAVRKSGSDEFCLAILLDNSKIYRNNQVLEDFVLKPGVLEAFGWNMEFVLCKDLHEDFEEEINRIEQRLELIHS